MGGEMRTMRRGRERMSCWIGIRVSGIFCDLLGFGRVFLNALGTIVWTAVMGFDEMFLRRVSI